MYHLTARIYLRWQACSHSLTGAGSGENRMIPNGSCLNMRRPDCSILNLFPQIWMLRTTESLQFWGLKIWNQDSGSEALGGNLSLPSPAFRGSGMLGIWTTQLQSACLGALLLFVYGSVMEFGAYPGLGGFHLGFHNYMICLNTFEK